MEGEDNYIEVKLPIARLAGEGAGARKLASLEGGMGG